MSHPSRVRELKQEVGELCEAVTESHPSRVRELKPRRPKDDSVGVVSHPSRVRELKLQTLDYSHLPNRRTPPGCVN